MTYSKKIYIISAVFITITVILIVFFVYPLFKTIKNNSEELITVKKNLIFFQNQIRELERFNNNYQKYEPNLKIIDELFIDSQTPLEFIKFLERTASNSGISLEILSISIPQKQENSNLWPNTTFELALRGDFSGLLKFLEKLEAGSYLIESESLTARKLKQRELRENKFSSEDIKTNLSIKVFTK